MKRLLIVVVLLSVSGCAQDQRPPGGRPSGRTETPTRGVMKYKAMERALLQAQQEKQQDKVSRMLADDFEVWSSEQNEPTPRELWEQNATASNITWFQIRNMAVRDFGNVSIV